MTIDDILKEIEKYNKKEIPLVKKAYEMALSAHEGQYRESGEPYITHPLHVCMNLVKFHADGASLCAGLLHDVAEDTKITIKDIEKEFGPDIAKLVDSVTKLNNMHFPSKDEATNANIRRLINSLNDDVRTIIIKLCDRLHNMQTLQYKKPEKQKRCAEETLNIFVPLAYFIGAFRLKCELEDLCLLYIDPENHHLLDETYKHIEEDYKACIEKAQKEIDKKLKEHNIQYVCRAKVMNLYQIYRKLNKGYKTNNIHDLVNLKIIVNTKEECYQVLGLIHELYTPMNEKFKDYIACPKTNMYKSIHTTVFAPNDHILQIQIKTKEMDEINTFGLAAYWQQLKGKGKEKMQTELKINYQFFNTLRGLNDVIENDKDFIEKVKQEIFTSNIYVYTLGGDIVELPSYSTVIDFAYKIHTEMGNHLYKAYVNGKEVKLTHILKNKDRIMIIQKETSHPHETWLKHVTTQQAKRYITKYLNKKDY